MNRRHFLATAAALTAAPYVLARSGKTYRTALIGCGWWGINILREAMAAGRANVVGLCDVDGRTLATAADEVSDLTNSSPKKYEDFRELLDKEKPEVVIVATPDHWHALPGGRGAQGQRPRLRRKADRAQRRREPGDRQGGEGIRPGRAGRSASADRAALVSGMKFLKGGGAGKVGLVRIFVNSGGGAERPNPNTDPPKKLNWDLYCGPADATVQHQDSPRRLAATSSTSATANSAIGASTGSTRFCGGPTTRRRRKSSRPAAGRSADQ